MATYAQIVDSSISTTSVAVDPVPWTAIPTKKDYLDLMHGDYFILTTEDIATSSTWCLHSLKDPNNFLATTRARLEDIKSELRAYYNTLEKIEYQYAEGAESEDDARIQEKEIRDAVIELDKDYFVFGQKGLWLELIPKLTEDGWKDMWMKIDIQQLYYCNWLIHLLREREAKEREVQKIKQEQAYTEANALCKLIGWY